MSGSGSGMISGSGFGSTGGKPGRGSGRGRGGDSAGGGGAGIPSSDDKKRRHVTFQFDELTQKEPPERRHSKPVRKKKEERPWVKFIYPIGKFPDDEYQKAFEDHVWVMTREFHAKKIEITEQGLLVYVKIPREKLREIYHEILDRINGVLIEKLQCPQLFLESSLTSEEYRQRIRKVRIDRSQSDSESAAPAVPLYETVMRVEPIDEAAFERGKVTISTSGFANKFIVEQNSKRLKITIRADSSEELEQLKSWVEEWAHDAERSKRVCRLPGPDQL